MRKARKDEDAPKLLFGRGYYVDFEHFSRLLHVTKGQDTPGTAANLVEHLGIATARVHGLVNLARGFGLVERDELTLTPLGTLVSEYDPFFDDLGTLWFLHYVVASEPRQLVWNRFANVIVPKHRSFTLQEFRATFADQKASHAEFSADDHVQKETLAVIDAYMNKHFARLAYLRSIGDSFVLGYREPVPPLILGASIARFRNRNYIGASAVSVEDLLTSPNSPGVIFQLPEDRLRAALEELKTQPGLSLESRADLDQVRLTADVADHEWMQRYYVSR